jgi:hypothetical protein
MRRLLLLFVAALTAALAAALIARAGAAASSTQFRTPDAGAACRLEGAALVCSTLASPGSVALHRSGAPTVVHELPWWDASTPALHTWRHGAILCRLDGSAILCRNHGGAILVARDGFAVAG